MVNSVTSPSGGDLMLFLTVFLAVLAALAVAISGVLLCGVLVGRSPE